MLRFHGHLQQQKVCTRDIKRFLQALLAAGFYPTVNT